MGWGSLPCYSLRIQYGGHNFQAMRPARARRLLALGGLCIGLAALGHAGAAYAGFRCGSRLVEEGDTQGAVRAACGTPTDIARSTIWRAPVIWRNGRPLRVPGGDVEVRVEVWTYNLGPTKLMRRIRFEDSVATDLDTLGYGYR